jgi:hypothetical protein
MKTRTRTLISMTLSLALVVPAMAELKTEDTGKNEPKKAAWAPAVEPKPLSPEVRKGLEWLVKTQNEDGGWNQGEESDAMRNSRTKDGNAQAVSNVADTCAAALALLRAGNDGETGKLLYVENIRRASQFVCGEVEESDADSLAVTSLRGTRLQAKIGTYIDTFLASLFLAEAKEAFPPGETRDRISKALGKVLNKIAQNQREDGSYEGTGWAAALSESIAGKGVNRAAQAGASVPEELRARSETLAQSGFDKDTGSFSARGSAGVELYGAANALANMQDSANTNVKEKAEAEEELKVATTDQQRADAQGKLDRIAKNEAQLESAKKAVVEKLETNDEFISGFGSNGGEEFLSYMNIGESLVVDGGNPWIRWDEKMTKNLNRIQNADGTWTGHHCITGRTFCTSAALLVLMVDRAPVPLGEKIRK